MPTINRPINSMVTELARPRIQDPIEKRVAETAISMRRPKNREKNPKVKGIAAAAPIVMLTTN